MKLLTVEYTIDIGLPSLNPKKPYWQCLENISHLNEKARLKRLKELSKNGFYQFRLMRHSIEIVA